VIHLPENPLESPPVDNTYQAAVWLVARHPMLARLVQHVPKAVDADNELDVDALADAVRAPDAYRQGEEAWDRWAAAGPAANAFGLPGAVAALNVMSRTEAARLRLLATLGTERVKFASYDLDGFDADGRRLVKDWCRVLKAGPTAEDLDAIEARFHSAPGTAGMDASVDRADRSGESHPDRAS
jgi:hypothetical protein